MELMPGLQSGSVAPGEVLGAGGAAACVARLDTGETSKGVFETFGDGSPRAREDSRRRKRGYHAELVRVLVEMVEGKYGAVAAAVAEKWLSDVRRCPGVVRRHKVCGRPSFEGHKCDFPLCPWCQARRSKRLVKRLGPLIESMARKKLWTFSPPNLPELDGEAVGDLSKVLTKLHSLAFMKKACLGGIRSIEVTNNGNGWNLHAHEVVDSGWVAHYPQWDIVPQRGSKGQWLKSPWKVMARHPGLAREFTRICQEFPGLKSPRLDFDLDNPDHWYFVDLRVADQGVAQELGKYVAKGSQVVRAGAGAVVEYLFAMKGKRLIQPFGNLYGVSLDQEDEANEVPEREGDCPYDDCPDPSVHEWAFVQYGFPQEALAFNRATGTCRLVFQGDG